jgi:hypothetical protein
VNHFGSKKGCITNIEVHNQLKFWWHPLVILNTSIIFRIYMKTPKFILSQNYLIHWLNKKDWIVSMYIEYLIYTYSTTIGFMFFGLWNTTEQKKIEKNNAMHKYKISSSFIW